MSKQNMDTAIVELRNVQGYIRHMTACVDDALNACEETLEGLGGDRAAPTTGHISGKKAKHIWLSSPYGCDQKRVEAIREWTGEVFATLVPYTLLPIPIVGRSGCWGGEFAHWSEDHWKEQLEWDLATGDWSGVIEVQHLFGPKDTAHATSDGMARERKVAEERGLPVLSVDTTLSVESQRDAIGMWCNRHFGYGEWFRAH